MSTYLVSRAGLTDGDAEQAFGHTLGTIGELRGGIGSIRAVWILDSGLKESAIRSRLRELLDDDDELLVSELSENWREQGLDDRVRGWLRRHLFSAPAG